MSAISPTLPTGSTWVAPLKRSGCTRRSGAAELGTFLTPTWCRQQASGDDRFWRLSRHRLSPRADLQNVSKESRLCKNAASGNSVRTSFHSGRGSCSGIAQNNDDLTPISRILRGNFASGRFYTASVGPGRQRPAGKQTLWMTGPCAPESGPRECRLGVGNRPSATISRRPLHAPSARSSPLPT